MIKRLCAQEALKLITDQMVIGLGGGSTISYLAEYLESTKLHIKVVTPSFKTEILCRNLGLTVLPAWSVDHIDIAFDGCDEVDCRLNALKSGGIHTKEKLIAGMADEYVLFVDENKLVEKLEFKYPVVLEVIPESISYIEHKVKRLGGTPVMRSDDGKDGFTVSDHGLLLMDVRFQRVDDIENLNKTLSNLPGVLGHSLFVNLATKALIVSEQGVRLLTRE